MKHFFTNKENVRNRYLLFLFLLILISISHNSFAQYTNLPYCTTSGSSTGTTTGAEIVIPIPAVPTCSDRIKISINYHDYGKIISKDLTFELRAGVALGMVLVQNMTLSGVQDNGNYDIVYDYPAGAKKPTRLTIRGVNTNMNGCSNTKFYFNCSPGALTQNIEYEDGGITETGVCDPGGTDVIMKIGMSTTSTSIAGPAITAVDPTCSVPTGSINVTSPVGGQTYTLTPGGATSTTGSFTGLAASSGPYTVSTSASGCVVASNAVSIGAVPSSPATPSITAVNPTCAVPTGSVNVTSPVSGVTYTLTPGGATSATGSFTGLAPSSGPYTVTASLAGCTSPASNAVSIGAVPSVGAPVITAVNPTCTVLTGSINVTSPISPATYTLLPGGATSTTGSFTGLAPNSGPYTVSVTVSLNGSCTSAPSNQGSIGAPATGCGPTCVAPSAVAIGSNATYCLNAAATTLSITYTGSSTGLQYYWAKDGVIITGANSSTYTPLTTTIGSSTYQGYVYNDCGNASSNSVIITVVATPTAPVLSATTAANVCPVSTADLTALVTSTAPAGSVLEFYTSATPLPANLVTTPGAVTASGTYYAFYKNTAGGCFSPASAPVTVTITTCTGCIAPSGVAIGSSATYCLNAAATTLSITYTGSSTGLQYYWAKDGVIITGANSSTYTPLTTTIGSSTYQGYVYNDCGNASSNSVIITVVATPTAPVLSATTAANVCPVSTADLTALVTSTAPAGSVLEFHTSNVPTSANLVSTPGAVTASGTYYAFYKNTAGGCFSPASAPVTVTITTCTSCTPPSAVAIGSSATYCLNAAATTLSITYTGSSTGLVYYWAKDGVLLTGENSSTYTPLTTTIGSSTYQGYVYNDCGNASSNSVIITVVATPTAPVLSATTAANVCPVSTADLTALVTSTAPAGSVLEFYTSATPLPANLVTTPGAVTASGTYYAFYKNTAGGCFSPASAPVTVTITTCTNCVAPSAVTIGSSATYCLNAPATTLSITYTGSSTGLVYYWAKDGVLIAGANSSTYTPLTTTIGSSAYQGYVYNDCGNASSNGVIITVVETPTAPTLSATSVTPLCPATTYDLTTLITSATPAGSTLQFYTSPTPSAGNLVATPNAAPQGTYYAFYTNGNCYSPASVSIVINACSLPVTLVSFTAAKEATIVLLKWATTEEVNADRFDLQRSNDAKAWVSIGVKAAAGESKTLISYNFTDAAPLNGSNYYRLKMIDKDETFAYSSIKSIEFKVVGITVYPNPVATKLFLKDADLKNIQEVSIISLNGNTVYKSNSVSSNGIYVGDLSNGIYLVKVTSTSGTLSTHKIVIARQ